MEITREQKNEIAERLNGTSGAYDSSICEEFNIGTDELEAIAEEMEILRCIGCGWWVEGSECELLDDGQTCEDCR